MNNKKGHMLLGTMYLHWGGEILTITAAKGIAMILASACIWHIPAWENAKANHTENVYQAQEMWPQQIFDKLPGGQSGRKVGAIGNIASESKGGYWEGLVLNK